MAILIVGYSNNLMFWLKSKLFSGFKYCLPKFTSQYYKLKDAI